MQDCWGSLTHAIVVCGHAVFTGGRACPTAETGQDKNWILQSFQFGEGPNYIEHIQRGVQLAGEDKKSLLIFSGGQTRAGFQLSEARSYFDIAEAHHYWGIASAENRITTEEYARDSYENVLFSLARFYECTGRWPIHLTIISWTFKRARFVHHVAAVRWPSECFTFEGVGVPPARVDEAIAAEKKTLALFEADPTGTETDGILQAKRRLRNPYLRTPGYVEPSAALRFNGSGFVPDKLVPWANIESKV